MKFAHFITTIVCHHFLLQRTNGKKKHKTIEAKVFNKKPKPTILDVRTPEEFNGHLEIF
jgi:hypothetical protein